MKDNTLFEGLRDLCRFLDDSALPYTLVGGLAVGIWGVPRATVDIDFLVALSIEEADILFQRLKQSDRFIFVHNTPMVFNKLSILCVTLKSNPDIAIDFLFADDEFRKKMLERRSSIMFAGFLVSIPTPEDLIILKLLSGRPKDTMDAAQILETQRKDLDMPYILGWCDKVNVTLEQPTAYPPTSKYSTP